MSTEHVTLLRRPLPPKNTRPVLKPLHRPVLSGAMVEASPETSLKGSAHQVNTVPWDFDQLGHHVTPIPTITQSLTHPEIIERFPCRPHRTLPKISLLDLLQDDPRYSQPPPAFLLNDFLQSSQSALPWPGQSLQVQSRAALSSFHYRKLLALLLLELHRGQQREVSKQTLNCEVLPEAKRRIPHRQLIYELEALDRLERQGQVMCTECCEDELLPRSGQTSLQLWTPRERGRPTTRTHQNIYQGTEVFLSTVMSDHLHGSRRTHSPLHHDEEFGAVSPADVAILECLANGGESLKLKAHFIAHLPDLSSLAHTLQYLNLSFNDLSAFPSQLFELVQLEVLKLRDNPIEQVPAGIQKLLKLKTLVISFCKLSNLPPQLFHLPHLQYLDVSYNLITSISNDLGCLRSLEVLNVEGNQLVALPRGLLCLSLTQLRLSGNYTHPLLWRSSSLISPPRLLHSATRALALSLPGPQHHASLPQSARNALRGVSVCDCCEGPMYGPGLKLIQPCYHVFGLHVVPIMFHACSPSCHWGFRSRTHSLGNLPSND